jgi:hypothetical protein
MAVDLWETRRNHQGSLNGNWVATGKHKGGLANRQEMNEGQRKRAGVGVYIKADMKTVLFLYFANDVLMPPSLYTYCQLHDYLSFQRAE